MDLVPCRAINARAQGLRNPLPTTLTCAVDRTRPTQDIPQLGAAIGPRQPHVCEVELAKRPFSHLLIAIQEISESAREDRF